VPGAAMVHILKRNSERIWEGAKRVGDELAVIHPQQISRSEIGRAKTITLAFSSVQTNNSQLMIDLCNRFVECFHVRKENADE
jgi:hypothetical protein